MKGLGRKINLGVIAGERHLWKDENVNIASASFIDEVEHGIEVPLLVTPGSMERDYRDCCHIVAHGKPPRCMAASKSKVKRQRLRMDYLKPSRARAYLEGHSIPVYAEAATAKGRDALLGSGTGMLSSF